jgi:hypothetical protein
MLSNIQNRQWRLKKRPVGDIGPDDLEFATVPVRELSDGDVLIRTLYLSLDPTNRIWMSDMKQYMPPVEIGDVMRGGSIGVVEDSRSDALKAGDIVNTGLGGWQDYFVAPAKMVSKVPTDLGVPLPAFMSVLGLTGLTAYFGLLDVATPKEGETIVVSAAAGAVGSIVGQIGKIKGCRVIGIAGSDEKCRWITQDLGFDGAINYKSQDVGAQLDVLCPDGINVNFENVGGEIMDLVLDRMNLGGRISLCGLISEYNNEGVTPGPTNFKQILMQRLTVRGFILTDFLPRFAEGAAALGGWLATGKIQYKVDIVEGLEEAPAAVKKLFSGDHDGKLLIKVSDEPV